MYPTLALVRVLVVALCAAVTVIVALVAGILSRVDGASLPSAVQRGAAAFAGALGLALVVLAAVGVLCRFADPGRAHPRA
ncbi:MULTISPECIES: hypothetical protein [unclassified Pseudofrankia]|uniref:hypothetical protein n=1 Tax=unclassified Pseudofrankia TaxID=2994372 RepID=UPI0008DA8081|nr:MULTISPECIES: hypothetical protein [unclassified Pseudofrankia]MDT3445962.1 hypothetical protein [Pseudofrankia sp. BMG5.37]OHV68234.1 hypothetical protein BCD48_03410 [Pseudofrankia sp. BMG5.36]